ncbi:hypothetical protein J437_LFUL016012 [Ladona fulva]|uniref:Uncharacterized protein n=1 Tax=Ladona fulva TaxID=123851 RepID=A0A8K0KLN0_LADFU|nr:hypothetical protein J437_LFUL016012 [Ladona fulva]
MATISFFINERSAASNQAPLQPIRRNLRRTLCAQTRASQSREHSRGKKSSENTHLSGFFLLTSGEYAPNVLCRNLMSKIFYGVVIETHSAVRRFATT